jgi:polyhydroxybutyrate depolymerase
MKARVSTIVSLAAGLLVVSCSEALGSAVFVEPGGWKEGIAPRSLSVAWGRGGLRFTFETPAVLQACSDLSTSVWEGIAVASPHILASETLIHAQYFRVLSAHRPVSIHVPASYNPSVPAPLVVSLHGHTSNGTQQDQYMNLQPLAEARGFLYCTPEGTKDQAGHQFWNASAACCDGYASGVDDSTYLRDLVETVRMVMNVDPRRIYFMGLSNGAFMSYRMAHDYPEMVAGVACLAGTMSPDDPFSPKQPVNILHIHGTADSIIPYNGGTYWVMRPHLGAEEMVQRWAAANGCTGQVVESDPSLDLVNELGGLDTSITRFNHQTPGGKVVLWTIHGGSHEPDWPSLSAVGVEQIVDWLLSHPKPE